MAALCQGSDDEPYLLSAQVNAHGVQETRCSCPYEYDGLCKHLVALLLAWAHTPEAFGYVEAKTTKSVAEPTTESALLLELRSRERDELAHLIVQLIETEPKLRAVVRRLLRTRLTPGDVTKTERAVAALVRKVKRTGYETNFAQVQRELRFQLRGVASLAAQRPTDAVKLYLAIIKGLMAAGEAPFQWDDDRHLVGASQECVAGLATLLPRVGASLRPEVLDVLCQGFVFDLGLGGYGFVAGADALLESASAQEWPPIQARLEAWLRPRPTSRLAKLSGPAWEELEDMDIGISDWGRGEVLALQAGHLAKVDGPQAANAFLKQHGTPQQQVDAHLAEGEFDAATQQPAHTSRACRVSFMGLPTS